MKRGVGIVCGWILLGGIAFAQSHIVPGHYTKSGHYVAAHEVKDRQRVSPSFQVKSPTSGLRTRHVKSVKTKSLHVPGTGVHLVGPHVRKSGDLVREHVSLNPITRPAKGLGTPRTATHKSPAQVASDMEAKGRHRVHRFYEGHNAKDGHYVKPHWQWVWVKD